jgi:hypothetical protein
MRGNLIDRSIALGYGDPASSPLAHVVCEEVWARNSPRRLSIGLSGAGNHRCGWRQTDRALPEFLAGTIRNKNTRAAYMTARWTILRLVQGQWPAAGSYQAITRLGLQGGGA